VWAETGEQLMMAIIIASKSKAGRESIISGQEGSFPESDDEKDKSI
jgi:hypothetical protein